MVMAVSDKLSRQGPKLTFLGRHQLATEIFFQSPKSFIKFFFFAAKHKSKSYVTIWEILVANFSLRIKLKRTCWGPQ